MTILLLKSNAFHLPIPARSVHTVITSPPYYKQRDYGQSKWIGGAADCPHRPENTQGENGERADRTFTHFDPYGETCPDCGATRAPQLGLENSLGEYIENLARCFDEVWRVLRDDGTLWVNIGDTYNGSGGAGGDYAPGGKREGQRKYTGTNEPGLKRKDLMGVPWRLAFALQGRGWYLRNEVVWHKKNGMPESAKDRLSTSHEKIFLFSKRENYYFDIEDIREEISEASIARAKNGWNGTQIFDADGTERRSQPDPTDKMGDRWVNPDGRQRRDTWVIPDPDTPTLEQFLEHAEAEYHRAIDAGGDVWNFSVSSYRGSHFATFPPKLPELCIRAGTSAHGVCADCGAPWERVTDRVFHGDHNLEEAVKQQRRAGIPGMKSGGVDKVTLGKTRSIERIAKSWIPGCKCGAEVKLAVVLDIFGGSGTTAQAARRLGRHGIALDLFDEALIVARDRLGIRALSDWVSGKFARVSDDGEPIFEGWRGAK